MADPDDGRGWILVIASALACTLGASIICVDIIVSQFQRTRNFRIQDSNTFMCASLSLSFGVMLFSALYSMLPSANRYLIYGGLNPHAAGYTLIGAFLGGVIGIQITSDIIHRFMPSEVVGCNHTHESEPKDEEHGEGHDEDGHHRSPHHTNHDHNHVHSNAYLNDGLPRSGRTTSERSPLLASPQWKRSSGASGAPGQLETAQLPTTPMFPQRRPSLRNRLSELGAIVAGPKSCDDSGPCFGYGEPCGQQCRKFQQIKSELWDGRPKTTVGAAPAGQRDSGRGSTSPYLQRSGSFPPDAPDQGCSCAGENSTAGIPQAQSLPALVEEHSNDSTTEYSPPSPELHHHDSYLSHSQQLPEAQHHHHVPHNTFLAIGLQTSIAIALHKLPEGFITFATNHASPQLGFSVFMALFIHNITEGFAMALPLYLALRNRLKAMLWSGLLGGLSQPLGAAVAAIWFKVAGKDKQPGELGYGIMFAITSGIMTSVALQLFSESLTIHHNRLLCISFAFIGMAILGFSFALTAK